jgi:hypothetical protein
MENHVLGLEAPIPRARQPMPLGARPCSDESTRPQGPRRSERSANRDEDSYGLWRRVAERSRAGARALKESFGSAASPGLAANDALPRIPIQIADLAHELWQRANAAAALELKRWSRRERDSHGRTRYAPGSAALISAQELLPWYLRLRADSSKGRAL